MKQYWNLFTSFFKVGIYTFGGGYAMIMMMNQEVTSKRGWCREEEFLDYLALAQSSPGPIAVNIAMLIGYHLKKWRGLLCAGLASILPSFIVILLVAIFFTQVSAHPEAKNIFKGIRPAVVALILYPIINFVKHIRRFEYPIFIAVAALIYFGISPLIFIISTIIFGLIRAYKITHNTKQ